MLYFTLTDIGLMPRKVIEIITKNILLLELQTTTGTLCNYTS